MLHTLIPTSERARLLREYRVRALIVLCFMMSLSVTVGIATLFPSFSRTRDQEQSQLKIAAVLKKAKDTSGVNKIENELAASSALVNVFADQSGSIRFSRLIDRVVSARGAAAITSMTFRAAPPHAVSIDVNGTAPTRDQLLNFKAALESLTPGTKVDLPISYLAKSVNVDFIMHITEPLP